MAKTTSSRAGWWQLGGLVVAVAGATALVPACGSDSSSDKGSQPDAGGDGSVLPAPSPYMTVSIDPPSVPADGTSVATVTVKFRNPENGQPWRGQQVVLTATGKGTRLVFANNMTNDDGVVTATMSSTVVESKTITAQVGSYYNSASANFTGCKSALFIPLPSTPLNEKVHGLITADFNRDGVADIAFANDAKHYLVWLNNGDGTYRRGTDDVLGPEISSLGSGDVNNDGKIDLILTTNANDSRSINVLLGKGDGAFEQKSNFSIDKSFTKGQPQDYNGDGKLDLVTSNDQGTLSVFLGNGDGTFQAGINTSILSTGNYVLPGDYDGDNKLDLGLYTQSDHKMSVLLGNGRGSFQNAFSYDLGDIANLGTSGDFNGDGKWDMAIGFYQRHVKVLLASGNGALAPAVQYAVGAEALPVAGDLDGDGKLDLLSANAEESSVSLLIGNGDGTFQPEIRYNDAAPTFTPILGDFNGDGKMDFAVTMYESVLRLRVLVRTGCSR